MKSVAMTQARLARICFMLLGMGLVPHFCLTPSASAAAPEAANGAATVTAVQSGATVVIESRDGAISYKAVLDPKTGGDITQVCIPADGPVVARELNDIFFLGEHGEDFTLRGWTSPSKFGISCATDVTSRKPDEVEVQVNLLTTGTFKILAKDETAKANLRKTHPSYKEKTIQLKRTYTFKADRIVMNDELLWIYPEAHMKTCYLTSAFMPGVIQGPVRLVNGTTAAGFNVTTSGGKKVPDGIAFPSTAENFLKSGYKVSLRTAATSFDLAKSDMFFYEKPWQQDWYQISGFMFRTADAPEGKPIRMSHEIAISKATAAEMPPVVTIHSPSWEARWMDEKGEVAKYKIGDMVKLSASAVNSDGTPVPDQDIIWDIHIDPWWNTPTATLHGSNISYVLPEVVNEQDKTTAKDRNLLGVISVKVKGKNGTEAVEPFAMLVGKAGN
jgi:hypothetical protein